MLFIITYIYAHMYLIIYIFYLFYFVFSQIGIRASGLFISITVMASLKYEIPLLDRNTRFALWQIKMQAVLAQMDLEDTLLGIDKMLSTLTNEEKKRKDRKALTQLHLYLSNKILQDVMKEKTVVALWKRLE